MNARRADLSQKKPPLCKGRWRGVSRAGGIVFSPCRIFSPAGGRGNSAPPGAGYFAPGGKVPKTPPRGAPLGLPVRRRIVIFCAVARRGKFAYRSALSSLPLCGWLTECCASTNSASRWVVSFRLRARFVSLFRRGGACPSRIFLPAGGRGNSAPPGAGYFVISDKVPKTPPRGAPLGLPVGRRIVIFCAAARRDKFEYRSALFPLPLWRWLT